MLVNVVVFFTCTNRTRLGRHASQEHIRVSDLVCYVMRSANSYNWLLLRSIPCNCNIDINYKSSLSLQFENGHTKFKRHNLSNIFGKAKILIIIYLSEPRELPLALPPHSLDTTLITILNTIIQYRSYFSKHFYLYFLHFFLQ